jgi:orotidine-5'-phosphate decarboxylase
MLDGMRHAEPNAEEQVASRVTSLVRHVPLDRRLVVALDVPTVDDARALVEKLGDAANFYKIGLQLLFAGGLRLAQELRDEGKWIFLDMKLLDIGNTVEKAVANVAKLGFQFLTVHGLDGKTMRAAITGRGDAELRLLAVTVLTNLTASDLCEQGIREEEDPSSLTLRRAKSAFEVGFDGVIASGHDAPSIRDATSKEFVIKTPGIRLPGSPVGDQERAVTPRQAIANGANYLVVGRPIVRASDPKRAAEQITGEIKAQLDEMESPRRS